MHRGIRPYRLRQGIGRSSGGRWQDALEDTQSGGNKASSGLDKLALTYVTSPLNVPTIIERDQNIFADAFRDMGISLEYAEINSGADQTQALASGDVQILYGVGATSVILSAANGADIKVLNMYSRSPKAFCMYSADDSLTTPESLKGKTIGGPAGTNLHELLVSYLAAGGLTMDAAYQAKEQGYHMVADGEGLMKAMIAVAVRDDFYNETQDVIDRFMEAQNRAAAFMKDNQEQALQIAARALDLDEEAVKEMYAFYDFSMDVTDEDKEGFQKTADFMLESGMIEEELDVDGLFL